MLVAATPGRFLEVFFTVLILGDILLVLLSPTYSADYRVVFRNSGCVAATVMVRLALTAPPYVDVLLGTGAAAFAVLPSVAYERLGPAPLAVAAATEPGDAGEA